MGFNSFCRALLGFFSFLVLLLLLFAGAFCRADDNTVEVLGRGVCADCEEKNILKSHAFSGIRVAIYCKEKEGRFKLKGDAGLDEEGNFKVVLPKEILDSEYHKEKCYAQLQSASSAPCPTHKGLKSAKIITKLDANGDHTFEPAEMLTFFTELCTSTKPWTYYKYPGTDSWKHHFEKHFTSSPQVKRPEPDSETKKPEKPSDHKKQKPQAPKKPLTPADPKNPKPSVSKTPSEKTPVAKSPSGKPQILKKPCPFPDIPKINIPKVPTKYFHNFKFPYFPPLPPHFLHP